MQSTIKAAKRAVTSSMPCSDATLGPSVAAACNQHVNAFISARSIDLRSPDMADVPFGHLTTTVRRSASTDCRAVLRR